MSTQKIASKGKFGTMKITDVKVDLTLNIRDQGNYDLESMVAQILAAGRIIKPLIIRGEDKVVLSGNRRTLGGQKLKADPNCPQELAGELDKVPVIVYTGLTAEEETSLILDHGGEKPISRMETALAVLRLDKQFYSKAQILAWMYHSLAGFTGNARKISEMPTAPKEKEDFLKKWFHGTLDNYILAAAKMGPIVREQFLLTLKKEDGLLKEGETLLINMSRTRVTELSKAKNADLSKDGKGWTVENGGEKFNELLATMEAEDKAGLTKAKVSRPNAKQLQDAVTSGQYKSVGVKTALLVAAGDENAKKTLEAMDNQVYRMMVANEIIAKRLPEVKNPAVAALLRAIIAGDDVPTGEIEVCFNNLNA